MIVLYLLSGIIFGLGLSLSGMIDPLKVKSFLAFGFADWNPALLFVLGSAFPIYGLAFYYLRKRNKTLNGAVFKHPAPRPVDRKLILGSAIFGLGWGLIGICPGPAIAHLARPELHFLLFILAMFAGFEIQKRLA